MSEFIQLFLLAYGSGVMSGVALVILTLFILASNEQTR